ncbi:MAG: HNH endonuclease [Leptolyngbyaceae cyanobacterium bins.302]|nr:HNH endonuclease [Leptolyngbyaceae cyanobacterium bins.302]
MQPRQTIQLNTQQTIQPAVLQNSVVVFSKNYLPVCRIDLKRAVVLLVTGQAEPFPGMGTQQWTVRSPSFVLHVPEHIRLTATNPERHWKVPPVNRREVFRRDHHTCQYCGSPKRLTIDHVVPRSKGGSHTWDNVVAACEPCNLKKSDRTLAEAGMKLATKPKPPMHPAIAFAEQFWKDQERS